MIKCIHKAKLYDLAAVTSLVTWLGLGIVGSLVRTKQMLELEKTRSQFVLKLRPSCL